MTGIKTIYETSIVFRAGFIFHDIFPIHCGVHFTSGTYKHTIQTVKTIRQIHVLLESGVLYYCYTILYLHYSLHCMFNVCSIIGTWLA